MIGTIGAIATVVGTALTGIAEIVDKKQKYVGK